jgi:hypothetical protein
MIYVIGLWTFLRAVLFGSAAVAIENLALRHQLRVLQRSVGRPRRARWDRILWVWLSRVWVGWLFPWPLPRGLKLGISRAALRCPLHAVVRRVPSL